MSKAQKLVRGWSVGSVARFCAIASTCTAALLACSSAGTTDATSGAAGNVSTPPVFVEQEHAVLCGDGNGALPGIGVPAGTTVTASGSYGDPSYFIDQDANTGWNAGDWNGWIEVTFPTRTTTDGIILNGGADPATPEIYTITGYRGATAIALGVFTEQVPNYNAVLPPMMFTQGGYDAIRIDVQGEASWVGLNEISLLTSTCTAAGGDGAYPSPCTTPPAADTVFCDDFDTEKKVSTGWTSETDPSGAVGSLGKTHYASAPASYHAENGYYQTYADAVALDYAAAGTIDVDVRLNQIAAGAFLKLTSGATNSSGSTITVHTTLSLNAKGDVIVAQSDGMGSVNTKTTLPMNSWAHIEVALTADSLNVTVNGATAFSGTPLSAIFAGNQTRSFELGVPASAIMNFDNMLVTSPGATLQQPDAGAPDSGAPDSGVDSGTDGGSQDSGSTDSGSADSGSTDAGTPFVVFTCFYEQASDGSQTWIDSDGTRHSDFNPIQLEHPYAGELDTTTGTAQGAPLDAADLAALLAAAQTLDTSTAGYTTTTVSYPVGNSRTGQLNSAGVVGANVLVRSFKYVGGTTTATTVVSNDPAAATIHQYCTQF